MNPKQIKNVNKSGKSKQNEKQNELKFKARGGTAGAAGQMYESKVISLVAYRTVNDEDIKEFYIASNLGDIGDLDDVCLKFYLDDKPVAVFVQAKHVDDLSKCITDNKLYNPKDKYHLNKYFDSYIKIKDKFDTCNDVMFKGEFGEIDCHYLIFTPVPNKIHRKKNIDSNPRFNKVKQLINVSDSGETFQLKYDEADIEALSKPVIHERIQSIGKSLVENVLSKTKFNAKMSAYLEQYYNVLVPEVLVITNESEAICKMTVNPKLYFATDSLLIQLKDVIYRETLKTTQVVEEDAVANVKSFLNGDSSVLSKLIGNVLFYDVRNNKLTINSNVPESLSQFKTRIETYEITELTVLTALETAGKEKLETFCLQVSATFIDTLKQSDTSQKNDTSLGLKHEINQYRAMAQDFLEHLYFYTKQGKEYEVGNTLVNAIANNKQYKIKYGIQAYTFFLKFHDQVQKWWIKSGSKYYFTKDYVTTMLNKIPMENYIDMLNFNCRHEIEIHSIIRYNDQCIQTFNSKINLSKITVVTTDSTLLTSIKLYQSYKERGMFINFETITKCTTEEIHILNDEYKNNSHGNIFIVIIDEKFTQYKELHEILENTTSKIIIVTKQNMLSDKDHVVVNDEFSVLDLSEDSLNELLQYEVNVQGQTAQVHYILDEECKKYIKKDIVLKILNNEPIKFGKSLSNPSYEDIEDIYIPRTIINEGIRDNYMFYPKGQQWKYQLNTFMDTDNKVHIVTAKSGMGKSTTLTHLSLETKKEYPQIWIVRINLLDFTDELLAWENKTIELYDTMKLILDYEFSPKLTEMFDFKIDNELLTISNCKLTGMDLLHLELFVHCYNKGDMIFLFDGFDEICPNYQREGGELIKNLVKQEVFSNVEADMAAGTSNMSNSENTARNSHQIWITSRPYNSIQQYLEDMFGDVLTLVQLSQYEQNLYYISYWNKNIEMDKLNEVQFANINSFFEYMSNMFGFNSVPQYKQKTLPITSIPLKYMYITAIEYFRSQLYRAPIETNKEELLKKWISRKLMVQGRLYVDDEDALKMIGVPLHMYIAASLFTHEINKNEKPSPLNWDLERHTLTFFERYLDIKLNIRFQDKIKAKTSLPEVMKIYKRERTVFIDNHKKMAFFGMFKYSGTILQRFLKNDIKVIKSYIKSIEQADERTGIIDRVKNGIPRFTHLVFAEHFCTEFVADCIKEAKNKTNIIDFVVNHLLIYGTIGLRNVFDQKIKYDTKLNKIMFSKEIKLLIFDFLIKQDMNMLASNHWDKKGLGEYERTMENALDKAIDNNLVNIVMLLVSSIERGLNNNNVTDVIKILDKGFFIGIVYLEEDEFIVKILNRIREIDSTKIADVVSVCKLTELKDTSNESILEALKDETADADAPHYAFDDL